MAAGVRLVNILWRAGSGMDTGHGFGLCCGLRGRHLDYGALHVSFSLQMTEIKRPFCILFYESTQAKMERLCIAPT